MKHFKFSSFPIFGLKLPSFNKCINKLKKKSHAFLPCDIASFPTYALNHLFGLLESPFFSTTGEHYLCWNKFETVFTNMSEAQFRK